MMISRPTPANSSTLRSPPRPSRSHSSSSRPNTPSRHPMATQSPRQQRTKASKHPPPSESDDALFALLGIPVPVPEPPTVELPAVPKKAQKKGLLALTQPQMAAIRADTSEHPTSTPAKSTRGRQTFANNSGTDSDAPGNRAPRTRGGKGKVKATHAHPGTDSEGFVPRPKHSRHKSEPATQAGEEATVTAAALPSQAPWDGPPRLDRELEPFAVDSMVIPDARTQALLEPLESSKATPARSSSARRNKQTKSKREREKERELRTDDSDAFETNSLSRSLPASGFALPNGKQTETEADVWDMPAEVGKGAGEHALTWQQALQNSKPAKSDSRLDNQTPTKRPNRKATPATSTRQQPARAAKGARRYSFDQTAAPPAGAGHGFVYPGMNANRAPQVQTPTRVVPASALQGALEPVSHAQAAGHGQIQGSALFKQYAGPTFHNSPLAGSLPRPNNDDF